MRRLAALALLLVAVASVASPEPAAGTRHLVLISIDALRPELYLDGAHVAPELQALRAAGSHARVAESVFPSVTYPSHASIVTGVRPARHGVAFNVTFEPTAERGRWYEEATDLRAPPLWEWARAAGLTTASVSWPSTLGARIDLLLPERDYYLRRSPLDLLAAAATPGLLARLGIAPAGEIFRDVIRWDAFLTGTAAAMIRQAAGAGFTLIGRSELDAMGAMPGAALGIEATPGFQLGGSCPRAGSRAGRLAVAAGRGGTHGYLPTRPAMATGFLAAGRGVRTGVSLDRIRLIDVAPTAARLLGIPAPPVEGRVLEEILE